MANQWKFNQILFNAWQKSRRTSTWLDDLIFNWFWLQNEHFITTKVNVWNMPNINLLTFTNPKSDWWWLLDRFYKERTIKIEWHILWESLEDTQNKIDSLKKALSSKQWYLDFKVWNVYRRILCTLTNSDIINRESYDIEHATYSLSFKAEKPFRSEKQWRSELFEDVSDEINEWIYNEWSEYSLPIINILVNSATNCNQVEIEIWDDKITINHSLTAWDILDINTDEKTVLLNTNSIDFSWKFPKLQAWWNVLTVKSNWTYSFDVSVLFPKNFL
jgi:hypothetical protein